jgi:predicted nucleotidyltransferase
MSIDTVLKAHRDEILAIATLHGATNVRVLGSVVRGEAGPDSDVDFLVDLEGGRSLLDLAKLLVDLEHLLHRRVDVVTENGLRPHVKEPILREAVAL